MTLPLARNAAPIVAALEAGMRPAGPVIVACHGSFEWDNAIVYADAKGRFRWDWVRGVPSVVVMIGNKTKLGSILSDIEECEPNQLDVVNHEAGTAWMVLVTKPKLKTFAWYPAEVRDWLGSQEFFQRRDEMLRECGKAVA